MFIDNLKLVSNTSIYIELNTFENRFIHKNAGSSMNSDLGHISKSIFFKLVI